MSDTDTLREPRFRLATPLTVTYVSGNSRGEGNIQDVSRRGFFVQTPMLPPDGAHVTALITTSSGQLLSVEAVSYTHLRAHETKTRISVGVVGV